MVPLADAVFFGVISFLFVHELDAIYQREWRFFVAPFGVGDKTGFRLFTAVHVPLLFAILLYLDAPVLQLGIDSFVVIHGLLHLGLRSHPRIEFESWFSRIWIFGGAVLGLLHLGLVL